MYCISLLFYRSNHSKPVHYYCILYLNILATIEVLCWRSSDATGLKCDGASLNHFSCVFLLLYLAQNKNHLKTPCNETLPSQWVSSLGLASLSLFFVKKCQFPNMIPSHFVGVIYRLPCWLYPASYEDFRWPNTCEEMTLALERTLDKADSE